MIPADVSLANVTLSYTKHPLTYQYPPTFTMAAKSLLILSILSLTIATPLSVNKRWTCGGTPPEFSCEPAATCKNVTGWADCATTTGLTGCGDPLPNATQPLSACQSAAFTTCGKFTCESWCSSRLS